MIKKERGPYGKNMIKFTIKFWTNNLPKNADSKTAWASGTIHLLKNEIKGIKPDMVFFNNLEEFPKKFQGLIDKNNIKLVVHEKLSIRKFIE